MRTIQDVPVIETMRTVYDNLNDIYFDYLRNFSKEKKVYENKSLSELDTMFRYNILKQFNLDKNCKNSVIGKYIKDNTLLVEKYACNGESSHYDLIHTKTSEVLIYDYIN